MAEEKKGRRVFLSFLGTGNYREGIYEEEGKMSKNVCFVQNAIIELSNNEFDEVYIFCTEGAKEKHLESLKKEGGYKLKEVIIKEGKTEEEIWSIFQTIYDILLIGDEITFDVTHSYRFLPMLGLLLLQHAKFLKEVKVKKLCYGAFEMQYEKDGKKVSPIMDFTNFSVLQDWSLSGNTFIKTGVAEEFSKLATEEFSPKSDNVNHEKLNLKNISNELGKIASDIYTVRGINIVEGDKIKKIRKDIDILKRELYPPFSLIINKVEKDIEKFKEKNTFNVLHTVEWCIKKGLYQQGITMLQEGLITILLEKVGLEYTDIITREEFSNYIGFENKKEDVEFRGNTNKMKEIIEKLNSQGLDYTKLKKAYCNVKKIRNDINHGGFLLRDNKKNGKPKSKIESRTFKENLEKSYKEIMEIFNINNDI